MTHRTLATIAVLLLATLAGAQENTTKKPEKKPCNAVPLPGLARLELRSPAGEQARIEIEVSPLENPCVATACLLTTTELAAHKTCTGALIPDEKVRAFSVGFRDPTDSSIFASLPLGMRDASWVKPAGAEPRKLVVAYTPPGLVARTDEAILQIEWSNPHDSASPPTLVQTDDYFMQGMASEYVDARYRISLFAGASYLSSQESFGSSFPELRALVETRVADRYQRELYCRQVPTPRSCLGQKEKIEARRLKAAEKRKDKKVKSSQVVNGPDGVWDWTEGWKFDNLRLYGDVGLTGATALTTDAQQNGVSAESFKGAKTFDAGVGAGLGWTFEVATRNRSHDTNTLTLMLPMVRIGFSSARGDAADTSDPLPFSDFFGLRLENETGHFAGAYFEIGVGQSDRFVYQRVSRLKADGYLPFTEPGRARLVLRLQVDRPSPFGALNNWRTVDTGETRKDKERLIRAGEVKVALMFTIDIRTVFAYAGGPTQ